MVIVEPHQIGNTLGPTSFSLRNRKGLHASNNVDMPAPGCLLTTCQVRVESDPALGVAEFLCSSRSQPISVKFTKFVNIGHPTTQDLLASGTIEPKHHWHDEYVN